MSLFKRLLDNNEERVEKAREQTERQQRESDEREREHQRWARENRLSNVPKNWHLLTGDKGEVQSYSDGSGAIHHVHPDGTALSDKEERDYLDKNYGSMGYY